MVTFDINGAIVEFDEKTDNYNSIRYHLKIKQNMHVIILKIIV